MSDTQRTVVKEGDRSYEIRKQPESHRYPVTVPTDILGAAGVEHRQDVGFAIDISPTGRVTFCYTIDSSGPLTVSVSRYDSSGELRVPGAVGAIFDMSDEELVWSVERDATDTFLMGRTTRVLEEYSTDNAALLESEELTHIKQDIDSSQQGSWSQEQFRQYIGSHSLAPLGWTENQQVELSVYHEDGIPTIVFSPTNKMENYVTQTASETGENQIDATLNVPNAVVYALGFRRTELNWSESDGELVFNPATDWEPPV